MHDNKKILSQCIGRTPNAVWSNEDGKEFYVRFTDGFILRLYHQRDCCEDVSIEEAIGDPNDLIGTPLLVAEEREENDENPSDGSGTWTFYTFRSNKGSLDIRFYGSSNGYYSESITCDLLSRNKSCYTVDEGLWEGMPKPEEVLSNAPPKDHDENSA